MKFAFTMDENEFTGLSIPVLVDELHQSEFAFSRHVFGYEFPDPEKFKNGASFKFVSVDISQGKSHSITAELRNGKVFILDENVEDTNLRDQEWIEAIVDDKIKDPEK